MGALPYIFPNAFNIDPRTGRLRSSTPWTCRGGTARPPTWCRRSRGASRITNAPPNIAWPQFIQTRNTDTFYASLHQGQRAPHVEDRVQFHRERADGWPVEHAGTYSFQNDSLNPLDSQFGFSNAALGVFSSIVQSSRWAEGANKSRPSRRTSRTTGGSDRGWTLDFGLRFSNTGPSSMSASRVRTSCPRH